MRSGTKRKHPKKTPGNLRLRLVRGASACMALPYFLSTSSVPVLDSFAGPFFFPLADPQITAQLMDISLGIESAIDRCDVGYIESVLSADFTLIENFGSVGNKKPATIENRATFLQNVKSGRHTARQIDPFFLHIETIGNIVVTYGRYLGQRGPSRHSRSRAALPESVWFERTYINHAGRWLYLSHRSVQIFIDQSIPAELAAGEGLADLAPPHCNVSS